jgi:hypothetical protein
MPVDAWNDKIVTKDLCVVGHGRGATSYAAHWLAKQDIMVAHERLGPQGIVESGFSVPTWGVRAGVHQGLTRDKFVFRHKVAIVRDPYKVIATYEQVEHPRAIFTHHNHIPLVDDLLPSDFHDRDREAQCHFLENDRALRVNAIARSVVRWTEAGIDYAEGEYFQAEGEWGNAMPLWLEERGLWTLDGSPRAVETNRVNHRQGRRLTVEQINEFLEPKTLAELTDYRERRGYE